MTKYDVLFDVRYRLLEYMLNTAEEIEGEHVITATIDKMVEETKIPKRTFCRLLKDLESSGLIAKSNYHGKKYKIPDDVRLTMLELRKIISK